jgi:hypothetical protein
MPITLKDRQKINHELKKVGFGGIDDPSIFAQIGTLYPSHEAFRGLLMSTAPAQRHLAYDSVRPHLSFVAKPLDVYEREIHEKAEREQWDIWDGSAYPKPFKVGEIESDQYRIEKLAQDAIQAEQHAKAKGVLELVCTNCTVAEVFPADTRKTATKKAHDYGWRWQEKNGIQKAYCPAHVPGRCTMTLECSECGIKQRRRVWDEQDGYAAARRLGWTISESCVCPECSTKPVLVQ